MVNEAARCLEEKVVASPEDADYGMILGTGFAPFRGGPLRFADHFGIAEMVRAGDQTWTGNCAMRFAAATRGKRNESFTRSVSEMKSPLEAPEKQIAEETSAKPPKPKRHPSSTLPKCRQAKPPRSSSPKRRAIRSMNAAVSPATCLSAATISTAFFPYPSKARRIARQARHF